jgi:hypothetical protein
LKRNFQINTILLVIFIITAIALTGGLLWGNFLFTRNNPVDKSFFIPWLAARTFLEYGDSPYSEQATQRAQILYYGQLAGENEDPLYLWVSMPGELFYIPLALVKDYDFARAIWMTLLELALIFTGILFTRLGFKKITKLVLVFSVVFTGTWIFNLKDIVSGSPIPFGVLALVCSFLLMQNHEDEIAGILLIIPFLMQGIFIFFFVFLFWWILYHRRWRILTGFGMVLGLLLLLSFLLLPDWIIPSLRGIYWQIKFIPSLSTYTALGSLWPVVGPRLGWFISFVLGFLLFLEWRASRGRTFDHFLWTACLSISITPLLGIPLSVDAYSALSLPALLLASILHNRWMGDKALNPAMAGLIVTWVAGWILLLFADPKTTLIIPVLLGTGLLWMKWWMIKTELPVIET